LNGNKQLGGVMPAFNFSQFKQCCAMFLIPFTCPLPPGAQTCIGGPGCPRGHHPPPYCK
jgi:hypothetical protein